MFFGLVRDYAGFGLCRLLVFISLILCYTLLYFAEPNQTDTLLYSWTLQYGAGIGLVVNNQQLSRMFPKNTGLILGTRVVGDSYTWAGAYPLAVPAPAKSRLPDKSAWNYEYGGKVEHTLATSLG